MEHEATAGQVEADPTGTTADAPDENQVQSAAESQTTDKGPDGTGESETFFDPKDLKTDSEKAAYKSMQREFTKRLQGVAKDRSVLVADKAKIDAYNQFLANPLAAIKQAAAQQGYHVIQGNAPVAEGGEEFKPQTWADVQKHFLGLAKQERQQELEPLNNEVRSLKKQNIEQQLNQDYPDWRAYEDNMSKTLQDHPTLVNDVDTLYRMSVPQNVLEQRAIRDALAKVKGETDSAQIGDTKTTSIPTTDKPTKKLTFEESVSFAKAKLSAQGLTAPRE